MRWMFLINVLSGIGAAVFSGFALSHGMVAGWGMVASGLFFVALAVPFVVEYMRFGEDFRRVGDEFVDETRRPFFPKGQQEVFSGSGRPSMQRGDEPVKTVVLLALIAFVLVTVDGVRYLEYRDTHKPAGTTISNF